LGAGDEYRLEGSLKKGEIFNFGTARREKSTGLDEVLKKEAAVMSLPLKPQEHLVGLRWGKKRCKSIVNSREDGGCDNRRGMESP